MRCRATRPTQFPKSANLFINEVHCESQTASFVDEGWMLAVGHASAPLYRALSSPALTGRYGPAYSLRYWTSANVTPIQRLMGASRVSRDDLDQSRATKHS